MGQHVVVHVDGGTVVDGVPQTLGEDGLARVRGQAEQEEAGLSRGKTVDRLARGERRRERGEGKKRETFDDGLKE